MYNNIKDRPMGNWPRDLVQLSYAKLRRNTLEIPPLKILESLKNSFTRLVGFKAPLSVFLVHVVSKKPPSWSQQRWWKHANSLL